VAAIERRIKQGEQPPPSFEEFHRRIAREDTLPLKMPQDEHVLGALRTVYAKLCDHEAGAHFFRDLLEEAAEIAWRSPQHAERMVERGKVPRWALMKALARRSSEKGLELANTPRRRLTDDEFRAFMADGKVLAIDPLFVGFQDFDKVPHPSIIHWVQSVYALPDGAEAKELIQHFSDAIIGIIDGY
jgi:hypothetical protein